MMKKGFTLLELLLVVVAISILAGIVVMTINPGQQFLEIRNAQRVGDVNKILGAVNQYMVDNNGVFPENITEEGGEICRTEASSCEGLIDLSVLTENERYLITIPVDPRVEGDNSSGYQILVTENGRVSVYAPYAEGGQVIEVKR